jgi:predicted membrane protein
VKNATIGPLARVIIGHFGKHMFLFKLVLFFLAWVLFDRARRILTAVHTASAQTRSR